MDVLGITIAHDSGVCLYNENGIVSFFKEERLSRIKRDVLPILAIQEAISSVNNIDAIVFCPVSRGQDNNIEIFKNILRKYWVNPNAKIYNLEDYHHEQHAALAFYSSGFSEASVIVVDRNGSDYFNGARESETIFQCSYPHNFNTLYKNFWLYDDAAKDKIYKYGKSEKIEVTASSSYGIVKVYEAATAAIGQHPLENGKTMGLAAYGNKKREFPNFFKNNTNIPDDKYFSHKLLYEMDHTVFADIDESTIGEFSKDNYQEYADYAWQVQTQTQSALAYLVEKALRLNDTNNIIITGGYGLNVVANQFLIKSFPNVNFYFEPIADDSGNAIGGAMLGYRKITNDSSLYKGHNLFFHGNFSEIDPNTGQPISIEDIANLIIDNRSVALYCGLAESGPRALGHRSILFNAMNKDAKDIVNRIKKREWYRPFALCVLEEDAKSYFDMLGVKRSPDMTISFDSLPHTKSLFPSVVHIDGSCRIQTVDSSNEPLYTLLNKMKEKTGHGVLLNTSFNLAGEPLVETPEDAIKTLQNSELDVLWFSDINRAIVKD